MLLKTFQNQFFKQTHFFGVQSQLRFTTAANSKKQTVQPQQKLKVKKTSPQKIQVQKQQTINEKIKEVDVDESTGVVTHKHLVSTDGTKKRTFPSMEVFESWMDQQEKRKRQDLKLKLTPFQYYITQGKGTERPFTGAYWETKDVGMYSCVVCTQRLFMFDHKFQNTSGFPTFWNGLKDAIKFEDDSLEVPKQTNSVEDPLLQYKTPIKRCTCSNCEAHLGHLYSDGPAPLGLRFQINSAALNFQKKVWFEIPKIDKVQMRKIKVEKNRSYKGLSEFQELLNDEKLFGFDSYEVRQQKKQEQLAAQTEPQKQTVFDAKGQQTKV